MARPTAVIDAPSTLSLRIWRAAYQTIEKTPKNQVALAGDRNFGWTCPNQRGAARCAAIESSLRAAGRMVVCVDAAADDSTAMMRSLSNGEDRTRLPVALRTSSECALRKPGPWTACAAIATIR